MYSEVFVNGQGQDVWCHSKQIITESTFYNSGQVYYDDVVTESCFALNLNGQSFFEVYRDPYCNPLSVLMHNYCVCSS
jgi:hypothetical protein